MLDDSTTVLMSASAASYSSLLQHSHSSCCWFIMYSIISSILCSLERFPLRIVLNPTRSSWSQCDITCGVSAFDDFKTVVDKDQKLAIHKFIVTKIVLFGHLLTFLNSMISFDMWQTEFTRVLHRCHEAGVCSATLCIDLLNQVKLIVIPSSTVCCFGSLSTLIVDAKLSKQMINALLWILIPLSSCTDWKSGCSFCWMSYIVKDIIISLLFVCDDDCQKFWWKCWRILHLFTHAIKLYNLIN